MKQGLKMINEIIEVLGDDINDLVNGLGVRTHVNIMEGELVIEPKFKQLVSIIAANNFTRELDVYTKEAIILMTKDFRIYQRYISIATTEGNAPILLRADLFLFLLKAYCYTDNLVPLEVLKEYENKKFYTTKKNIKSIFEFYIGKRREKEIVRMNKMDTILLSILTGKTENIICKQIYEMYLEDQKERSES